MTIDEILAETHERGVRFCNLEFTDVVGMAKAVTVPVEQLPTCLHDGRWFDGSSLEGFARVAESDMYLRPDPQTFAVIPWEPTRARVLCDVVRPDGTAFEGDPRSRLRQVIAHAERISSRYQVAPEIEFFLLQQPQGEDRPLIPFDRGSYFDLIGEAAAAFWRELMSALDALHVPVEASHHEAADGQYEIDLVMLDALAAADAVMATKLAIKAIAARHGLLATFLPKPMTGINGSGMHIHQRLVDLAGEHNLCAGADFDEYGLSELGLRFIAGLLAHAGSMSAILAPLVNSYKRLVPNFEAPVEITWGHQNQDTLVRVPKLSTHSTADVLIEIRSPDPSCNPYLALTVLLAAGIDGIERELDCPPPTKDIRRRSGSPTRRDIQHYRLPESLAEALTALESDLLMREALGPLISDEFLDAKWQEWEAYRREVTSWEIHRYLALF